MSVPLSITACYAFVPLDLTQLRELEIALDRFGEEQQMHGLVLIAPEGINATVSGSTDAIAEWKRLLTDRFGEMQWKDSTASKEIFRRWSVKRKEEIVALKDPTIRPSGRHKHLSPEEWKAMAEGDDAIIIDARNAYETAIGKFRGAIDPGIDTFQEFPDYVSHATLPKEKKILLYCTGGIRCEKALLAMEAEGYQEVYQLEGGILSYLEKFPDEGFEGECFVFDKRVSVDQHLRPSKRYGLCPHCGDPAQTMIRCACGSERRICDDCGQDSTKQTCSKQCRSEIKV